MKTSPIINSKNGLSATDYLSIESDIAGVDEAARMFEQKWGVGRLRLIVSMDLRQRFDAQRVQFNEAIWSGSVSSVRQQAEGLIRGWQALDAAATASGQQPLAPDVWEAVTPDGEVVRIVRTNAEAHAVSDGRKMQVWTLAEIGNMIGHYAESAGIVKQFFDGATVESVRTKVRPVASDEALDDIEALVGIGL